MGHLTLRQLRVFEQVARLRSISAAAQASHLTQPAVSMQVKSLEEGCGVPLTELVGRRLYLTDAGREVAGCARQVRLLLEDLDDRLSALGGANVGRLRVGVVSTAKYFAPRLLAAFRRLHPRVNVTLAVENREQVIRMLEGNDIDLAVMGVPPQALDADAIPFADHPHALVVSGEHRLARRRKVALADLADETLIVRERGSGTRAVMERYFASVGFVPRNVIEMTSNETIKQAVMAGFGIAFLSLHTVGLERSLRLIAVPPVPGLPVVRRWHVVHLRAKKALPMVTAFREFARSHGRDHVEAVAARQRAGAKRRAGSFDIPAKRRE